MVETRHGSNPAPELNARARGWLQFLWRKATTPDDWSESGTPHPWWDCCRKDSFSATGCS